ncbi:hypothetical protein ccrud_08400 [Corynebacterium crudilactis]|uniref:Uncharacterized protein n=2 Tax=Corynebacterium crudilactis TaxID=1652495 RepID=A0A172QXH6_9CORY|nr:hypothetical protein ccrud_08400 [Corynebacterium crudilactis]
MPGSPALVPQLAPADTAGARLLGAVREVFAAELGNNEHAVELIGSQDAAWFTGHSGSLRAWGAPSVTVAAGYYLPEILQRFALGSFEQRVASVRDHLGELAADTLSVLALDGPTGLTVRAPSALVSGADAADAWCRSVLSGAPREIPTKQMLFDASLREPQLWLELAALVPAVKRAELIDIDDTHGVGRYVARWTF